MAPQLSSHLCTHTQKHQVLFLISCGSVSLGLSLDPNLPPTFWLPEPSGVINFPGHIWLPLHTLIHSLPFPPPLSIRAQRHIIPYQFNKTSAGSSKKQESSRKTSIAALLTMPKPLTVWITINCGKFLKIWEYQTT